MESSITKKDTIQANFMEFHSNNPEILALIEKQCKRAYQAGKKKFSIKQIIEYIRWEVFIDTKDTGLFSSGKEKKKFKINNVYASRYARLIIERNPYMKDCIEMRSIRSA